MLAESTQSNSSAAYPPSVLQPGTRPKPSRTVCRMESGRRDDERGRAYHDDRSRYSQQHGQQPPRRKRSRSPSRDDLVWGRDRKQWGRTSRSDDGCSGDSVWGSRSRSYGGRSASLPYASQAVQHRSRPVAVPRQHENLQHHGANWQQGGCGVSAHARHSPSPAGRGCSHPPYSLRGAHPHIHSCHTRLRTAKRHLHSTHPVWTLVRRRGPRASTRVRSRGRSRRRAAPASCSASPQPTAQALITSMWQICGTSSGSKATLPGRVTGRSCGGYCGAPLS